MNNVRREQMRAYIESNQVVTLRQLSQLLPDVSLMTIHRDLNYLQEQGFIVKIRGGARYIAGGTNEPTFSAREIVNKAAKQSLVAKAVPLISGSSSIFIDAGTTTMAFAKQVPDIAASIITTGPNIALELAKKANLIVSLCGGVLNKHNLTLSGTAALDTISKINIDTAFMVASGYSPTCGFTCGKESEAKIKTMVIEKARTSVMLMDSSKLDRMLPYTFAALSDFDYLVTEQDPINLPDAFIEHARECGVRTV